MFKRTWKNHTTPQDTGLSSTDASCGSRNTTVRWGRTDVRGLRGSSQIQFDNTGHALINGQAMMPGTMETLADGGHAQLSQNGKTLTIMTGEGYTVIQEAKGSEMDIQAKSSSRGVAGDGRMPGGLLGQAFDGDKIARNSGGPQGEGAIGGSVQDYEVPGGVFGSVIPSLQRGVSQETLARIGQIFSNASITPPLTLPDTNPITGNPVDWNQSLSEQTLDFMISQTNRQAMMKQSSESNQVSDKLLQTLLIALRTGNIDLAMLLFSSLESREASGLTRALTQKLLEAQQNRRQLTGQLTSQDKNAQNKTAQVQANVQEVNDTIQLLTTFIRDVNDQKNRTMEFANNFLSGEHQTTMSIVRGMRA
jgi:hypothetical protein